MKKSLITLVPEPGDIARMINYRPISIKYCHMQKFSTKLFNKLYPHYSNFIIPEQHVSVRNKSSLTNLTIFNIDINNTINNSIFLATYFTT